MEVAEPAESMEVAEPAESTFISGGNVDHDETVALLINIAECGGNSLEYTRAVSLIAYYDWDVDKAATAVCAEGEE